MRKFYIILIILPTILFSNDFQQGNIAFTNKNYEEAITHYISDIDTSGYSTETLYNLSNIYQKLDKPGYALYYLYKARVINPMEKFIQTDISIIEEDLERQNNYKHIIPIPYYMIDIFLSISLLLFIISLSLLLIIKKEKKHNVIRYISYLMVLVVIISSTMKLYTLTKRSDAIILEDSRVQLSPYENSDVTFNISETSIISISNEFEDYFYITDSSDRYGWIKKDMVGKIWK